MSDDPREKARALIKAIGASERERIELEGRQRRYAQEFFEPISAFFDVLTGSIEALPFDITHSLSDSHDGRQIFNCSVMRSDGRQKQIRYDLYLKFQNDWCTVAEIDSNVMQTIVNDDGGRQEHDRGTVYNQLNKHGLSMLVDEIDRQMRQTIKAI